jgi:tetratricopeptide (TPR) repeat protein
MNTQLKDILAVAVKESLRPKVDEAFNAFKRKEQQRVFAVRSASAIAATLLLFLTAPLFLVKTDQSPETLFSQNFEMPDGPSIPRGGSSGRQWMQALDAYDQARYTQAAGLIETALQNPAFEDKMAARYLLGICLSKEARYEQAIEALEKIDAGGILYPDAQWYVALFCLKANQVEKAKKYLIEMAGNDGHFKQREAAAILKKLK